MQSQHGQTCIDLAPIARKEYGRTALCLAPHHHTAVTTTANIWTKAAPSVSVCHLCMLQHPKSALQCGHCSQVACSSPDLNSDGPRVPTCNMPLRHTMLVCEYDYSLHPLTHLQTPIHSIQTHRNPVLECLETADAMH